MPFRARVQQLGVRPGFQVEVRALVDRLAALALAPQSKPKRRRRLREGLPFAGIRVDRPLQRLHFGL